MFDYSFTGQSNRWLLETLLLPKNEGAIKSFAFSVTLSSISMNWKGPQFNSPQYFYKQEKLKGSSVEEVWSFNGPNFVCQMILAQC